MTNLSVRMKKETIDELDRIAKLLGIDRATIVRKIINTGIRKQKIEVALDLYQKGDTLERAANKADASLWDLPRGWCPLLKNKFLYIASFEKI
ncbi:hypothetical protein ES705_15529 [subsurface metagenome]